MRLEIKAGRACGRVNIAPSKSVGHRLLINAALTEGVSLLSRVPSNEDIAATVDCLRALGAQISLDGQGNCTVQGMTGGRSGERVLSCRESGSTLRFLIPVALLDGVSTRFEGSPRLMERPLEIYRRICAERGIEWRQDASGLRVCGRLCGGEYSLAGNVSSQFVTGLLLALAEKREDSRIVLTTPPESNSYIDITVKTLADFGISVERPDPRELIIRGGQHRVAVRGLEVEGDESGAAFFGGLNALGGSVDVEGLSPHTLQGDRVWRRCFDELRVGMPTISVADCPDLAPVLMAVAAALNGVVLTDTARLCLKESDRGEAMRLELEKCGVKVEVGDNSIRVSGRPHPPHVPIDGHNDHRVVMAMAVLLTVLGGELEGAEAVSKSMPEFFGLLEGLGIEVVRK